MLVPLTTAVMVAVAALGLVALIYLALDRPVDDGLLLVAALVELGLLVLAVTTAVVHALTLPIIPPVVVFIALKEKTRWAMGVVIAGAFTVGVMTYRILQIWQTSGPA